MSVETECGGGVNASSEIKDVSVDVGGVGVPNVAGCRKYQSNIANHLVGNSKCAELYSDDSFSILFRVHRKCYLGIMEALFINSQKPQICKQVTHVTKLKLFAQHHAHS